MLQFLAAIGPAAAAIGVRMAPAIQRVGAMVENRINLVGLTIGGVLGWAINDSNQKVAERRHQEEMAIIKEGNAQRERDMAALIGIQRDYIQTLKDTHASAAAKLDRNSQQIEATRVGITSLSVDHREALRVISGIKLEMGAIDRKVGACLATPSQSNAQALPSPELALR